MRHRLRGDSFGHFGTILASVRRTDGQTERRTPGHSMYRAAIASRGKNRKPRYLVTKLAGVRQEDGEQ